jgi:hypothetical protein
MFATAPANPPGQRANQQAQHQGLTPAFGPTTNCKQCHRQGGAAGEWAFAGFAVNPQGGAGKPGIDVCVVNPGNQVVGCAKTDQDGYYWYPVAANNIVAGAKVAVRYNNVITNMVGTLAPPGGAGMPQYGGGDCNASTCHGGGQGRVFAQ